MIGEHPFRLALYCPLYPHFIMIPTSDVHPCVQYNMPVPFEFMIIYNFVMTKKNVLVGKAGSM